MTSKKIAKRAVSVAVSMSMMMSLFAVCGGVQVGATDPYGHEQVLYKAYSLDTYNNKEPNPYIETQAEWSYTNNAFGLKNIPSNALVISADGIDTSQNSLTVTVTYHSHLITKGDKYDTSQTYYFDDSINGGSDSGYYTYDYAQNCYYANVRLGCIIGTLQSSIPFSSERDIGYKFVADNSSAPLSLSTRYQETTSENGYVTGNISFELGGDNGNVAVLPVFKNNAISNIYTAYFENDISSLEASLAGDFALSYDIAIEDEYGRNIGSYSINGNQSVELNDTSIQIQGENYVTNSDGMYLTLNMTSSNTEKPIVADEETGLPNYGIMVDLSDVDFSEYPETTLSVKFNPNGDKTLNSQPDRYNDAAVKLYATTGTIINGIYSVVNEVGSCEAYPDSNNYYCTFKIPLNESNTATVLYVFPADTNIDTKRGISAYEKNLSSKFNFSYEISLEDKYGRVIKSYTNTETGVSTTNNYTAYYSNYIAGGTLSNVYNQFDSWKIELTGGLGDVPTLENAGLQFELVGDIPNDFDLDNLNVTLKLSDKSYNSAFGYSSFGYSISKSDNYLGDKSYTGYSNYIGGPVVDYSFFYTLNGGKTKSDVYQQRIGYGNNSANLLFSYYDIYQNKRIELNKSNTTRSFSVVPQSTIYSIDYSIISTSSKYKIEVADSNVEYTVISGGISSVVPVCNAGTALHTYKLQIVQTTDENGAYEAGVSNVDGLGLPNYGILIDTTGGIYPDKVYFKNDEVGSGSLTRNYIEYVYDVYYPYSDGVVAFLEYYCNFDSSNINPDEKYFLYERVGTDTVFANYNSCFTCSLPPIIPDTQEVSETEYNTYGEYDKIHFELNDKYYIVDMYDHPESGYSFEIKTPIGYCRIKNDDSTNYGIISIRPITYFYGEEYEPLDLEWSFKIDGVKDLTYNDYSSSANHLEIESIELFSWSTFESNEYSICPDVADTTFTPETNDYTKLKNDDGFRLTKINQKDYLIDYVDVDEIIFKQTGSVDWYNSGTDKYIGSFNIDDVNNGLLVTNNGIQDRSSSELPYVNIDLYLNDEQESFYFLALFGEVKDGIFYVKRPYDGDWSQVGKQVQSETMGTYTYDYGMLSSEYTYTLHAHLNTNEAVIVMPVKYNNAKYCQHTFNYTISTRNINQYNIDELIDSPTGNITRYVGNSISYVGSTVPVRNAGTLQEVYLNYKGYTSNTDCYNTYNTDNVKYVSANLFDYDFTGKQTSALQFLYDTTETSTAPWNTWHDGVYANIVQSTLDDNGLPVFNYSTPFTSMFNLVDEIDENGNTKKSYDTALELAYDEETGMYSYNSVMHAASYNAERNVILTYNNALGIDSWGMKGAGFFPFDDFTNTGTWGSTETYNPNIWLVNNDEINYFFGMSLDLDFTMPDIEDDVIFKFTGDDDVWVFLDGELVLDIGGIHEAITGTINLTKGVYTVDTKQYSLAGDFSVGTTHNISMFYLERGGTLSNCSLQFNIPLDNEIQTYKLTYDSNGATSGEAPIDNTPYLSGEVVTLQGRGDLERFGYGFDGWTEDMYSDVSQDTVIMDADKTVYASWDEYIPMELPLTGSNTEMIIIIIGAGLIIAGISIMLVRNSKRKKD